MPQKYYEKKRKYIYFYYRDSVKSRLKTARRLYTGVIDTFYIFQTKISDGKMLCIKKTIMLFNDHLVV